MGYDISADYVDSTTTYEPRSTIIDSDFIGTHSKWDFIQFFQTPFFGFAKNIFFFENQKKKIAQKIPQILFVEV